MTRLRTRKEKIVDKEDEEENDNNISGSDDYSESESDEGDKIKDQLDNDEDDSEDADVEEYEDIEVEAEGGDIDLSIKKSTTQQPKKKAASKALRRQYLNEVNQVSTVYDMQMLMRKIFQEAQPTVAVHNRQLTILKTLWIHVTTINLNIEFNEFIAKLVNKILPVKKNIVAANRVVKFLTYFFQLTNPATDANKKKPEETVSETVYTELYEYIITHLMEGLDAINSTVRYRVCHLLTHLIPVCGDLDETMFNELRDGLYVRIFDRDTDVRVRAISALANLQGDNDDLEHDVIKKIRYVMTNDLKADVRRSCMENIVKNRLTEKYIVGRVKDIDATNRRLLFSKILPQFGSYTNISADRRIQLLETGLKDTDESVRKMALKWLTETWMKDSKYDIMAVITALNVRENSVADIAVRELINQNPKVLVNVEDMITNSSFFDKLTPQSALLVRIVFEYCQDEKKIEYIDRVFPEVLDLVSIFEKNFDAKVYNEKQQELASKELQETGDQTTIVIEPKEFDFIIIQLLKIAVSYDYTDEYGRNKMLSILISKLSDQLVDTEVLPGYMECLRRLAANERDFCRIAVEIINEIKDEEYDKVIELKRKEKEDKKKEALENRRKTRSNSVEAYSLVSDTDDESEENAGTAKLASKMRSLIDDSDSDEEIYHSAVTDISAIEAEKSRQIEINQVIALPANVISYCLNITKCMLEIVFSPLKKNELLNALLYNFIVQCINERTEVENRDLALKCHALCGILDKDVAINTMHIAVIYITKVETDDYLDTGLQVMGDLLAVHGTSIIQTGIPNSVNPLVVSKLFYRYLRNSKKPKSQILSAIIIFKLLLCKVVDEPDFFENAVLTYFDPNINKNPELKHCLEFCITTYVYSLESHQKLLVDVVYDILERIFDNWSRICSSNEELKGKNFEQVRMSFIIKRLIDWTDPYLRAGVDEEEPNKSSLHIEVGIHLMSFLRKFNFDDPEHKQIYKPIINALEKIAFTSEADISKIREFSECFSDNTLLQGDIGLALEKDSVCKRNFLKAHTYVNQCLQEAEERLASKNRKTGKEETDILAKEELESEIDIKSEKITKEDNHVDQKESMSVIKEEEIYSKENIEINQDMDSNMRNEGSDSEAVIETKINSSMIQLQDDEEAESDSSIEILEELSINDKSFSKHEKGKNSNRKIKLESDTVATTRSRNPKKTSSNPKNMQQRVKQQSNTNRVSKPLHNKKNSENRGNHYSKPVLKERKINKKKSSPVNKEPEFIDLSSE